MTNCVSVWIHASVVEPDLVAECVLSQCVTTEPPGLSNITRKVVDLLTLH